MISGPDEGRLLRWARPNGRCGDEARKGRGGELTLLPVKLNNSASGYPIVCLS